MTPANAILDWSWSVLARTLASLLALQGWAGGASCYLPRAAWRSALAQLRQMEAAARRLLVAMAADLGLARRHRRPQRRRTPPVSEKVSRSGSCIRCICGLSLSCLICSFYLGTRR